MKRFMWLVAASMVMFISGSGEAVEKKTAGSSSAVVTAIDGSAQVFTKKKAPGRALKKGDKLTDDNEILVGDRSQVEIRYPDGSVMRLAQKSRFLMSEVKYDPKTETKNITVGLSVGRLWAKVRKLTADSSVQVKTANAVAGVRGTVYRVNVEEDNSAMVKVYDGSVYVANPPRDPSQAADMSKAPHEVSGPHAVPPPYHEVTMEEWTEIVKAMQQITISPQGIPSKPQDFDPKAEADDWVKWNQERDKELDF